MPHENDTPTPPPPDANEHHPEATPPAAGSDEPFDQFPEVADIGEVGKDNPEGLEPLPEQNSAADDEAIDFGAPPPPSDEGSGSFTLRAALADLPDLADILPPAGPPSGIPPVPVASLTPLAHPPVVVASEDDLVPLANTAPAADHGSSTTLAAHLDPPSGVNLTADSGTRLAELARLERLPASEEPTEEHVPVAAAAADSGVIENLEPVAPVQPASGWYDGHADRPAGSGALPTAAAEPVESSDIFTAGPVPVAAAAEPDLSDVIRATAGGPPPGPPFGDPHEPAAPTRPSDVALSFDAPPGGSTVADPTAIEGLPVADDDEAVLAAEAVEDPLDSARLADAPELPAFGHDEADLGAAPPLLPDASSILAELSGSREHQYLDSSAIRLEDPGVDRTLSDEPLAAEAVADAEADLTQADEPLPHAAPAPPGSAADIDLGASDGLFDDELAAASGGHSSIFSDARPADPSGASGNVPVARPDPTDLADAVEFAVHPDPSGADSGSFHRLPAPAAADDDGEIDWNAAEGHPEATMGIGAAGIPASLFTGPASGILSRGKNDGPDDPLAAALADDPSAETVTAKPVSEPKRAKPKKGKAAAVPPGDGTDPSAVIDWVSDSSTSQPPLAEPTPAPKAEAKARPAKPKGRDRDRDRGDEPTRAAKASPAKKGGLGWVLGPVAGLVVGVGACAGIYFSGALGDNKPTTTTNNASPQRGSDAVPPGPSAPPAALVRSSPRDAVRQYEAAGASTPAAKADLGEARLLAALRGADGGAAPAAADLTRARADLEAAANEADRTTRDGEQLAIRSTLKLALSYEVAGDHATARRIYTEGITKFPANKAAFEAALDRLDATAPPAGKASRLAPADAEQLVLATNFLVPANPVPREEPPAAPEPPEAGPAFWKAVNAAAKGDYDTAVKKIDEAKALHAARARALAGQGLNPTSDPLEQIFPRCCDDLKASWTFRKTEYPKLIAAGKDADAARAEAKKEKDAADKLAADLKAEKENATKLADAVKAEKETAAKAADALKVEKDKVTVLEKDLKATKNLATKSADDAKKAKDDATALAVKLKDASDALAAAEKARADAQATLDTIAKELQAAKVLPPKYDTPGLVSAVKNAAKVASNPELAGAVERAVKAEADAKAAKDELSKAAAKYEADAKKLKDELAADRKKTEDAAAAEVKKAKDATAAEVKKAEAAAAADKKKLADAHAAELKKQADAAAKEVTALRQQVADEQARTAAMAKKFEADLGNAVGPGQALDQWLTILTGLRRPADADPALAAADKVLKTAPPGTEDHAKALTVAGLARLVKGEAAAARTVLAQAVASPAYKDAAASKRPWAAAADVGLASVDDPVAPLRRPVEGPTKDPVLAAKNFDAGVTAYRAGRFADAEKALAQAAWHDETNPLTWYFLGAARWQLGRPDQAKADFAQGAEREKGRTVARRTIEAAIAPIQGAARDALTDARR